MNNENPLHIMQLNCNGIRGKLSEIKKLVYLKKPSIVSLNETWLSNNYTPTVHGYSCEWKNRIGAGGGLGLLINLNMYYTNKNLIPFNEGLLEVQAIQITTKNSQNLDILNLYNPNKNISKEEMLHYINQLGNSFVIVGDFNAHTPVIDNKYQNYRNRTGITLEEILTEEDVILLNPLNFITYLDRRTGRPSCLDLCLLSPNLATSSTMFRECDVGSDHAPILIKLNEDIIRSEVTSPRRWKLSGINWDTWRRNILAPDVIVPNSPETINDSIVKSIMRASNEIISKTSGKPPKKRTPWWNVDCSKKVALRRQAKRKVEKYPSANNLADFKAQNSRS